MTDEQFGAAVHVLSASLSAAIHRRGIGKQEAGKVLTATVAQSLAQMIGPVAAIERLRDMADLMEAQIIQDSSAKH
jgi:hypothetical protein